MKRPPSACAFLLLFALAAAARAEEKPLAAPKLPDGADEALQAIAALKVPDGFEMKLFAAEPQLGNPVAIDLDEQGRLYVAEQYRFNLGTEENRTRPFLLEDDLQIQTCADRLEMYQKWAHKFDGGMDWFRRYTDQLRRLEDRDGDGRADRSTVFAAGFNHPLDGLAAGVLASQGKVYFTCIPNLWLLEDPDGDGRAERRNSLHYGFGVNCAFLGHDLHGLVFGPDGRLYFSVGDRGFHVKTPEGDVLHGPRRGAVFRCRPDGSGLEIVHRGLRNPQELAFDEYGNLFAADNNCDKGDHSRLVYVVEGGDSGWNMAYQTIPEPYLTGPWHAERMWHLDHDLQPAWIVPPVGKLGSGPSGFLFTGGVGLPDRESNRFLMCNYTGNGGIESFDVEPAGAGFRIVDPHDFLKPIRATDVAQGYDGRLYVSDYVKLDWQGPGGRGRVYTLRHARAADDPDVRHVERLFRQGFADRDPDQLAALLRHPDMRVRLRAQSTLARRGHESLDRFRRIAAGAEHQLARIHALWGIGQLAWTDRTVLDTVLPLLDDPDSEVRAQAARVLYENPWPESAPHLLRRLDDDSPRVRFFALLGLGKLRHKPALEAVFALVRENDDADRYLRHAAVMALTWIGDADALLARADHPDRSVRLAVLLALRRMQDPRLVRFLADADVALVTEAARAINDLPLDEATPALAAVIDRYDAAPTPGLDPLLRRAINACFRLGGEANARRLAALAAHPRHQPHIRQEALDALATWHEPPPRDRVTGFWRPLPKRPADPVRAVLPAYLPQILASDVEGLQTTAAELIGRLGIETDDETFLAWVRDRKRSVPARVAALKVLATHEISQNSNEISRPAYENSLLEKALQSALNDPRQPRLRAEARHIAALRRPKQGLEQLQTLLADPDAAPLEQQRAFFTLAALANPSADALLTDWLARLTADRVPPPLRLDLLEAASSRHVERIEQALERYQRTLPDDDPLARFRVCLSGGDPQRGRELFVGHPTAQCVRCHKVGEQGGDAGPELSRVAKREDVNAEYLLRSLVDPDAKIAPGFGTVTLVLADGRLVAGTLKQENDDSVVVATPEGQTVTIPRDEIDQRSPPKSAMPPMTKALTPRQIRDLVAYLATLK